MATKHMSDMTSSFKSKTEKFVKDIATDLRKKPILKHPGEDRSTDTDDPQAYREESRVAQYGNTRITKPRTFSFMHTKLIFGTQI